MDKTRLRYPRQTSSIPWYRRSNICHSYKILGHYTYHRCCYQRQRKNLSMSGKTEWWFGHFVGTVQIDVEEISKFVCLMHVKSVCFLFHKTTPCDLFLIFFWSHFLQPTYRKLHVRRTNKINTLGNLSVHPPFCMNSIRLP